MSFNVTTGSIDPDELWAPSAMLKRYREGANGLEPHPQGEFVRIDEAARHFQWHAFNRVLFWIHAREERFFSRGLLHRELIDMRPAPLEEIEDSAGAPVEISETQDAM